MPRFDAMFGECHHPKNPNRQSQYDNQGLCVVAMDGFEDVGNLEPKKIKRRNASHIEQEYDRVSQGYTDEFCSPRGGKSKRSRQENASHFQAVADVLHQDTKARTRYQQSFTANVVPENPQRLPTASRDELGIGIEKGSA
jgi:hypothetical protein